MFPLQTNTFPADANELERLLNESVRQVLITRNDPVRVVGDRFAALKEININLDGAELRRNPPPPRMPAGATSPALQVAQFSMSGERVSVGPATIDLSIRAQAVGLSQGRDARDEILLTLERAENGTVEVSISKAGVEKALAEVAKSEAGKQGVTVDDVRLNLRQVGPRALETEASFRARKMFFSTTVRITAKLEIDEQLNAQVSNLNCAGDGAIGSLACGFLAPHLAKVDERTFPLMTLSMGEVRLRDVHLSVGERLIVTAEFGG